MSALLPIMDVKPLEELYRARNQSFQFQIKAERGRLTLLEEDRGHWNCGKGK